MFDTDSLNPGVLDSLRQRERLGRDAGAIDYLERLRVARGEFRMAAEDAAVRAAVGRGGGRALDAGAGVGRHALPLAPRFEHVTCVDLSARALEVLEQKATSRGITNVSTLACDLCELPGGLGPFDAAWSCETLQHIPGEAARRAALFRIRVVLRPGARLVVTTLARNARVRDAADGFWPGGAYRHHFTPSELAGLITEAGFRNVSVRGMLMIPGVIGRRLPPRIAALDVAAARLPRSADFGRFLIATAHA